MRTFDASQPLSDNDVEAIRTSIAAAHSPFGGKYTIDFKKFDIKGPLKPSTYGVIDGASWYLLEGIGDGMESALSAGFAMEQVVLKAASMGLGTCWMALTFKGADFTRDTTMPADTPLRIISPMGYPTAKRRLIESITRMSLRSSNRRPMEDIFFQGDFGQPVDATNVFYQALAMMRLAPSAKNSQPWRALVKDNTVYFYYEEKTEAAALDLGIGLCHFALTLEQQGHKGTWAPAPDAPAHTGYIPTWKYTL